MFVYEVLKSISLSPCSSFWAYILLLNNFLRKLLVSQDPVCYFSKEVYEKNKTEM